MKTDLVNRAQPFGQVTNTKTMPSTMASPKVSNKLGGDTMVENRGMNQPQSNADKNPGAFAHASRNYNNPFAPTGLPKKGGR